MNAVYYDGFSDFASLPHEYKVAEHEVVYAGYSCEDYEGSAIVVFVRDGKLFENNDGHCSCNGLENWEPEETSAEALMIRNGWPGLAEAVAAFEAAKLKTQRSTFLAAVDPAPGLKRGIAFGKVPVVH